MYYDLKDLAKRFCAKKNNYSYYHDYKVVKNLILSDNKYSLLFKAKEFPDWFDSLPSIIKASVMSYQRKKRTAISIYKLFINFVKKETGLNVDIEFPPIDSSSEFERRMYIVKYFQVPENKIEGLPDLLWVDERTIETDLKVLRAENEIDSYTICGKTFSIPGLKRTKGALDFPSTVHPLFLTSNLSQVLVTLKGLKKMSRESIYERYATRMAKNIWSQLSDYAKKRIYFVCDELIPENKEWYESLETDEKKHFYSEYDIDNSLGANNVLTALKNGKPCFIEYITGEGESKLLKGCLIRGYEKETIKVEFEDKIISLDSNKILRSAFSIEELI